MRFLKKYNKNNKKHITKLLKSEITIKSDHLKLMII